MFFNAVVLKAAITKSKSTSVAELSRNLIISPYFLETPEISPLTISKDTNLKHKLVLSSNGILSWKYQLTLKIERKQGKKKGAQHYRDVNPAAQVVVGPLK
uniref:Uncharacterized protein n=1 Tax=Micrurus paraensis TaxID=1970185 RepID=A0A2D4L0H0_9SAUR